MRGNSITLGNTNAAILRGEEDVSAWDDEELLRGQKRDKNGKWSGRPPKVVPLAIHVELNRRRMSRAREVLDESLEDAVKFMVEVVRDKNADADLRLKAATQIMDRVMGKAPEKMSIRLAPEPWEEAVAEVVFLMDDDGDEDDDVIDTTAWPESGMH